VKDVAAQDAQHDARREDSFLSHATADRSNDAFPSCAKPPAQ
jgi:hypothetical protein